MSLSETTGSEYNIVPGAGEEKDPVVTVTATVDSYVFVTVTDSTDGLVSYTIADGWEALAGYDGVYYRTVSEGGEAQSFSVLAGDRVYYASALENSDMLVDNGDGTYSLKDGVELSFRAYAIQREPFTSVENAYLAAFSGIAADSYYAVNDTDALTDALADAAENGNSSAIILTRNVQLPTETGLAVSNDTVIDLNGYTLSTVNGTFDNALKVENGAAVTIENGKMNITPKSSKSDIVHSAIYVTDGNLTLENVAVTVTNSYGIGLEDGTVTVGADASVTTVTANKTTIAVIAAEADDHPVLNVYGTVTNTKSGGYAIANNGNPQNVDHPTEINIYAGAEITAVSPAIYHAESGTLNINGGTITGYSGIVIAAGTMNICGGTITGTADDGEIADQILNDGKSHSDGSGIMLGAAYRDITVNMSGGTVQSTYEYGFRAYATYSDEDIYGATVNFTGGACYYAKELIYIPSSAQGRVTVDGTPDTSATWNG